MALRVPPYGVASLSAVLPAALHALAGDAPHLPAPLDLRPARAIVVVLVDGLGANNLSRTSRHAPFLSGLLPGTIEAGMPSTTATSIASLGTGVPAATHGLVGYTSVLDAAATPPLAINWLTWADAANGKDLRDSHPATELQTTPTAFERASAAGVGATVVASRLFEKSGLTEAALRGAQFAGVTAPADLIVKAAAAAARPGRQLVYAYLSELDLAGHIHGPDSDTWAVQLELVDDTLRRLAERLPADADLYVTADHGMITVDPAQVIDYDTTPELRADVQAIAGEARLRVLFAQHGAADSVADRWRSVLGPLADVVPSAEAIEQGVFGPEITDAARRRLGDVLVICRERATVIRSHAESMLSRMIGHHGAATDDELFVPLLRWSAAD